MFYRKSDFNFVDLFVGLFQTMFSVFQGSVENHRLTKLN